MLRPLGWVRESYERCSRVPSEVPHLKDTDPLVTCLVYLSLLLLYGWMELGKGGREQSDSRL